MTRERLLSTLKKFAQETPEVLAAWEQGSKAFGRADDLSDVDLSLVVRDTAALGVVQKVEERLAREGFVPDLRWEVPQPSWHGHWQAFYRFRGLPPLHLLDLAVIKASAKDWLCEPEVHGAASDVWVDREGLLKHRRLDRKAHAEALRRQLERVRVTAEIFHPFVEKELQRGRPVDALHFYNTLVVSRLVEALRMLHCPQRSTFGLRYLKNDLPATAAARIERLLYVPSPEKLPGLKAEAMTWLGETLATLAGLDLARHLEEKIASKSST